MFKNDQNGAIATAVYYLSAQNWALALNDNGPVNLVCQAKRCQMASEKFRKLADSGEHIRGGRITSTDPHIKLAIVTNGARWLYRVDQTTEEYRVVDRYGNTVDSYAAKVDERTNIYLRWAGKLWSVILQTVSRK